MKILKSNRDGVVCVQSKQIITVACGIWLDLHPNQLQIYRLFNQSLPDGVSVERWITTTLVPAGESPNRVSYSGGKNTVLLKRTSRSDFNRSHSRIDDRNYQKDDSNSLGAIVVACIWLRHTFSIDVKKEEWMRSFHRIKEDLYEIIHKSNLNEFGGIRSSHVLDLVSTETIPFTRESGKKIFNQYGNLYSRDELYQLLLINQAQVNSPSIDVQDRVQHIQAQHDPNGISIGDSSGFSFTFPSSLGTPLFISGSVQWSLEFALHIVRAYGGSFLLINQAQVFKELYNSPNFKHLELGSSFKINFVNPLNFSNKPVHKLLRSATLAGETIASIYGIRKDIVSQFVNVVLQLANQQDFEGTMSQETDFNIQSSTTLPSRPDFISSITLEGLYETISEGLNGISLNDSTLNNLSSFLAPTLVWDGLTSLNEPNDENILKSLLSDDLIISSSDSSVHVHMALISLLSYVLLELTSRSERGTNIVAKSPRFLILPHFDFFFSKQRQTPEFVTLVQQLCQFGVVPIFLTENPQNVNTILYENCAIKILGPNLSANAARFMLRNIDPKSERLVTDLYVSESECYISTGYNTLLKTKVDMLSYPFEQWLDKLPDDSSSSVDRETSLPSDDTHLPLNSEENNYEESSSFQSLTEEDIELLHYLYIREAPVLLDVLSATFQITVENLYSRVILLERQHLVYQMAHSDQILLNLTEYGRSQTQLFLSRLVESDENVSDDGRVSSDPNLSDPLSSPFESTVESSIPNSPSSSPDPVLENSSSTFVKIKEFTKKSKEYPQWLISIHDLLDSQKIVENPLLTLVSISTEAESSFVPLSQSSNLSSDEYSLILSKFEAILGQLLPFFNKDELNENYCMLLFTLRFSSKEHNIHFSYEDLLMIQKQIEQLLFSLVDANIQELGTELPPQDLSKHKSSGNLDENKNHDLIENSSSTPLPHSEQVNYNLESQNISLSEHDNLKKATGLKDEEQKKTSEAKKYHEVSEEDLEWL